ncbi:MAG: ThuA domain-containing protein [Opitutaceae bacterium]
MKNPYVLLCAVVAFLACSLQAAPKKLLVVTVTTGFRHSVIPLSEKVLTQLAEQSGGAFTVEFVRQPAGEPKSPPKPRAGKDGDKTPEFLAAMAKWQEADKLYQVARAAWMPSVAEALKPLAPANLKNYDGVIFASTTGDLPLPDKQGLLDWIAEGHAFVGIHAATDTFHGFPAFIAMIGGEFKTHGPQVSVSVLNQDSAHSAVKHLPAAWTVFDEIYQFKNFERSQVRGLLGMNQHPNDHSPGDYPVSWAKKFGAGHVFYTSLGHRDDVWDPAALEKGKRANEAAVAIAFQQHVLGGILWSLSLASGDSTPQPVKLN